MTPIVSVIIAAYQAEGFVHRSIASARAQTLRNIEIIVVDDASPDATVEAARRAAQGDPRVAVHRLKVNSGPGGARNAALSVARGDWIAILDADDSMTLDRLERLVDFATREHCDIAADNIAIVSEDDLSGPGRVFLKAPPSGVIGLARYVADNLLFEDAPCTGYLKPIFRRAFLAQHGLVYDAATRIGEDYLLVADALACGAVFKLIATPGYRYTTREGSISHRAKPAHLERLLVADAAFRVRRAAAITPQVDRALRRRERTIEDALAFLNMLEAIKDRSLARFIAHSMARPLAWRHFRMPVRDRFARWAKQRFALRRVESAA